MYVDERTMNVLGQRSDGSTRNELIARVYAAPIPTSFTLYADDGEITAYQNGAFRTTAVAQQRAADGTAASVSVAAADGTYQGAPASRSTVVELVTNGMQARAPRRSTAAPCKSRRAPPPWRRRAAAGPTRAGT